MHAHDEARVPGHGAKASGRRSGGDGDNVMQSINVTMPIPPPEIRGNSRAHWAKKAGKFKAYKITAFYTLREAMIKSGYSYKPVNKVEVHYQVFHCAKAIDHDNFIIGMKAFVDCLASPKTDNDMAHGLIPDDSPDHFTIGSIKYIKVKHRTEARVEIEITEVGA